MGDDPLEPKLNRLLIAVCILLVSIAATCNGPPPPRPADVEYSDGGRFSPAVRVSYEFAPGNDQRRRGSLVELLTGSSKTIESPEEERSPESSQPLVQPSAAFDVDFASIKSRGTDQALAGQFAELDGIQFTGPTTVRAKSEEHRGQISIRTGVRLDDILSLEALLGVSFAHRDLWIQNATRSAHGDRTMFGFMLGARATVRPIALFDVHAQFQATAFAPGPFEGRSREVEVISNLNITKNLALFTGYRWTWYDEKAFAGGSDVEFRAEGPTAGINLHF